MDQRDTQMFSGSGSFYLQRGIVGLGTNPSLQFQSNMVGNAPIEPSLPMESYSTIPPPNMPFNEPARRKRGRPRKYGHDAKISLAMPLMSGLASAQKRGRGRPRKQPLPSPGPLFTSSTGMAFTAHVISIAVGQDVTTRIMSFSQQEPTRAMSILSANGALSSVTLYQPSSFTGSVTYEGRFEILCLSGSYFPDENNGQTGGLTVTLATPDGRVIGGGVGGVLIAATSVQVIVGSFALKSSKGKNKAQESRDNAGDSSHGAHNTLLLNQTHAQPGRSLVPTSSMEAWHGSHSEDVLR